MKSKQSPLIITTQEALVQSLDGQWSVLYIDEPLCSEMRDRLFDLMDSHGYTAGTPGKHSMFFLRSIGENAFDPERHEIHDPFGIL